MNAISIVRRVAAEATDPAKLSFFERFGLTVAQWLESVGFPPHLAVFVISMLPVIELRGGIPVAGVLQIPFWQALPLCMVGNFIPIPFILLLIVPLFGKLKQTRLFRPMVEKLETHAMNKRDRIEKSAFWGLVLFVGIPLPGTGGWTGALIAALLGLDWKKSSLAIALGILLAAAIMSFLTYGIPRIISLF